MDTKYKGYTVIKLIICPHMSKAQLFTPIVQAIKIFTCTVIAINMLSILNSEYRQMYQNVIISMSASVQIRRKF